MAPLRGRIEDIALLKSGLSALERMQERNPVTSEAERARKDFGELVVDGRSVQIILNRIVSAVKEKIAVLQGEEDARLPAKEKKRTIIGPKHFVIPDGKGYGGQNLPGIECSPAVSAIMVKIFPEGGLRYLMILIASLLTHCENFPDENEFMSEPAFEEKSGYRRIPIMLIGRLLEKAGLVLNYDPMKGFRVVDKL